MTKAKPQSKLKNRLNEVMDLARCMVDSARWYHPLIQWVLNTSSLFRKYQVGLLYSSQGNEMNFTT